MRPWCVRPISGTLESHLGDREESSKLGRTGSTPPTPSSTPGRTLRPPRSSGGLRALLDATIPARHGQPRAQPRDRCRQRPRCSRDRRVRPHGRLPGCPAPSLSLLARRIAGRCEGSPAAQTSPWSYASASPDKIVAALSDELRPRLIVGDENPVRVGQQWRDRVARHVKVPFYLVDGDVVVPSSHFPHEEYAARTLRPKIHRLSGRLPPAHTQSESRTSPGSARRLEA